MSNNQMAFIVVALACILINVSKNRSYDLLAIIWIVFGLSLTFRG